MPSPSKRATRLDLLSTVLSAVIALVAAFDTIGQPARLVHVLTIFFGGVGAGAGIVNVVVRRRLARAEQEGERA
jgi:hypothetical protein